MEADVHNVFCVCFIHVSTEVRDLISVMLNINPLNRPSLKQILKHPWMTMKGDMASTILRIHSSVGENHKQILRWFLLKPNGTLRDVLIETEFAYNYVFFWEDLK